MALNINGRMKVKTLRSDFKKEFELSLRVYDGINFADDEATLASIRKGDNKGGEFSVKRNTNVGKLKDKIMDMFGIKTQIAGSDDSYLCDNDKTLAGALEADEKLMGKRAKKEENNKEMTLNEIIEKVKIVYSGHQDLEEIVNDLNDEQSIDYWARKFAQKEYPQNLELAKALFKVLDKSVEGSNEIISLAESVFDIEGLNDQEWAIRLYKKALEKAEENRDFLSVGSSIAKTLNDKEWASEIFKSTQSKITTIEDYNTLLRKLLWDLEDKEWARDVAKEAIEKLNSTDIFDNTFISEVLDLAKIVAINNKEQAKEVFDKIEECDHISYLLDSAVEVREIYEGSEYAEEYSKKMLKRAMDVLYEGYYCDIYCFLKDELKDIRGANNFKNVHYDELREEHNDYDSCGDIFEEEDIDFNVLSDGKSVIGFRTETFVYSPIEDMFDEDDDSLPPEAYVLINDNIANFLDDIKNKLQGFVESNILISLNGKVENYSKGIVDNPVYLEEVFLYIIVTKEIPADTLNKLFLDMDGYGFYAMFKNYDADEFVVQGYDYGEYDTGYYSDDSSEYINEFRYLPQYEEVSKKFLK